MTGTTAPPAHEAPSRDAGPGRLNLVIQSPGFEKVHYALVIASAALATNRAATLFFTMDASRALFAPSGWRQLRPERAGATASTLDMTYARRGVATFEELLSACADMGARFMVCDMGLRALGLENAPLRPDLSVATGGVVTFLNDAGRDGQMLFI